MSGPGGLAAWLGQAGAGDLAAFRHVYDATSAKLFGIVLRILHERGEAEDVLQEVYTTVWRKAAEFDATRASPITWMATIARNRAIDRLRARSSRPSAPLDTAVDVADDRATAEQTVVDSDEARRLHAALDLLDARHAAAIRGTYFEGLTYEALALRDGVPVGTLKSWVRRGLIRMKGELTA